VSAAFCCIFYAIACLAILFTILFTQHILALALLGHAVLGPDHMILPPTSGGWQTPAFQSESLKALDNMTSMRQAFGIPLVQGTCKLLVWDELATLALLYWVVFDGGRAATLA
jgi:hypothetical protein